MKYFVFLLAALLTFEGMESYAQEKVEPWTKKQLLEPEALASRISQGKTEDLLILSIGPDAIIKGSVDIGPGMEKENIEKLKAHLSEVPRNKEVVIYCGCCPFDRCPNIRPAFTLLKQMGFKKGKLLNIRQNIKVNWLDKDYPTTE